MDLILQAFDMHSCSLKRWACRAARLVLSRQFPGRGKRQTIFKWKLWIRGILQSAAKNRVKTLKSCTRQFSHASGFLLMVLRLWFWRIGLSIFQWDVSILRGAHYHSSSIIFCASQPGERWCAVMCSQGWDLAKKPVALLCTQLKWFSFKFAQELIIHLFFSPRFGFIFLPRCTFSTLPSKFQCSVVTWER